MNAPDKISFVITTYNRALLLKRAIDSILAQTYTSIEIVVVDDASSDNTCEMMKDYQANSHVCYYRFNKNSGPQVARNFGLEHISGNYIVVADSDDTYHPDFIRECLNTFRQYPDASIVYCGCRVLDGEGRFVKTVMPKAHLSGNLHRYALENLILSTTGSFMFLKKCFDNVRFDTALPCWHDDDIFIKLSEKFEFQPVNKPLLNLYFHTGARVSGNRHRYAQGHFLLIEAHKEKIGAVLGNKVLSRHYLNAAIDFLLAGDKEKYTELISLSKSYHFWNDGIKNILLFKKYIHSKVRYVANSLLFLKARILYR